MTALNPAATVAWVILLAIPVGFAFLVIARICSPSDRSNDGGGDAGH